MWIEAGKFSVAADQMMMQMERSCIKVIGAHLIKPIVIITNEKHEIMNRILYSMIVNSKQ